MLAPGIINAQSSLLSGKVDTQDDMNMTQSFDSSLYEYYPVTDDNMLWADDKTKYTKVQLKKKHLELQCKEQGMFVSAVSKVPVDFKANIVVNGIFAPWVINDKHKFGFIFNARNELNFHAIVFGNKYAYYITAEKGQISVEERALYKISKNKAWNVAFVKEGSKCTVMLDGMEIMELNNLELDGNKVGFYTDNKSVLYAYGVGYFQQPEEEEN